MGFLITSFSSFFVSRTSIRSEISLNILPLTSDNIYSEIQRDLLRPIFISSLMANDTFLRDWVIGGEIGEHKITKYLKEIQGKYETGVFSAWNNHEYQHKPQICRRNLKMEAIREKLADRVTANGLGNMFEKIQVVIIKK